MGKSKKRSRDRDEDEDVNKRICRLEHILADFIKETREKVFSKIGENQKSPANTENVAGNGQDPKVVDKQGDKVEEVTIDDKGVEEASPEETESIKTPLSPSATAEVGESGVDTLDAETETVLGDNPTADNKKLLDLHQSLVSRWPTWMSEGLKKETKEAVIDKYPRKGNINLEAPELNEEVLASLNDTGVKRDKLFVVEQNLIGSAMAALGQSITMILNDSKEPVCRLSLVEMIADAGKLLAQTHYQISSARKSFISPGLAKPMKELLQKTKPGALLYGDKLTEKIKAAKSVEKMGKEIKNAPASSSTTSASKFAGPNQKPSLSSRTLNWRGPYVSQGNSHAGQKFPYQKSTRSTPQNNRTTYSSTSSQAKPNRSVLQDKRK